MKENKRIYIASPGENGRGAYNMYTVLPPGTPVPEYGAVRVKLLPVQVQRALNLSINIFEETPKGYVLVLNSNVESNNNNGPFIIPPEKYKNLIEDEIVSDNIAVDYDGDIKLQNDESNGAVMVDDVVGGDSVDYSPRHFVLDGTNNGQPPLVGVDLATGSDTSGADGVADTDTPESNNIKSAEEEPKVLPTGKGYIPNSRKGKNNK